MVLQNVFVVVSLIQIQDEVSCMQCQQSIKVSKVADLLFAVLPYTLLRLNTNLHQMSY